MHRVKAQKSGLALWLRLRRSPIDTAVGRVLV